VQQNAVYEPQQRLPPGQLLHVLRTTACADTGRVVYRTGATARALAVSAIRVHTLTRRPP
jgi:hypothetical protein